MTIDSTPGKSPSSALLGPSVPNEVMLYVHAYGDSRADDDGLSGLRIGEAVLALRRWAAQLQAAERERMCDAIKAADDKATEGDYMLDSDDCIRVIRRTWGLSPIAPVHKSEDRTMNAAELPSSAEHPADRAQVQRSARPYAWMHADGRIVPAATKETAERDGGAMRSSLAGYDTPLYGPDALAEERERCARIVERINGWIGTREVAAEIRGETQILKA